MSWNLLQSAPLDPDPGLVSSTTKAYASNVKLGSLLVATVRPGATGRTVTLTDTMGNTWIQDINAPQTTDGHEMFIFHAFSTGNAIPTVTFTISGAASTVRGVSLQEWSGPNRISILNASHAGQADAGTALDSGAFTTTVPDTLIIAAGGNSGGTTMTAGTGYTLIAAWPAGAGLNRAASAYQIVHANSTYNGLLTSSGSTNWSCAAVAFVQGPEAGIVKAKALRPHPFSPGLAR